MQEGAISLKQAALRTRHDLAASGVRSTRRNCAPSLAEEHPPAQISNAELSSPRAAKGHETPQNSKPLEEHSASHQISSMKASRKSLQDPVAKAPPGTARDCALCIRALHLHLGNLQPLKHRDARPENQEA